MKVGRWIPLIVFAGVLTVHSLYFRNLAAAPPDGWADVGVGAGDWGGFRPYIVEQDYLVGLSYAIGAAFTAWALIQFLRTRQKAMAAGAAGSVTVVGGLMAGACFLTGCCGSPMLGIYLGLFGGKALGIGKPLMAAFTIVSAAVGYWYLRRKSAASCCDRSCICSTSSSAAE